MTAQQEDTLSPRAELPGQDLPSPPAAHTTADSISPQQQPPALPAWPHPRSPSKFRARPRAPHARRERRALKWLFTAASFVPRHSSGRSRLICLLLLRRSGWKGGDGTGVTQTFLFSGRARAPSAADFSENRRAGDRRVM